MLFRSPGPLALIDGSVNADDVELAARLIARFSKGKDAERVQIEVTDEQGATRMLDVAPLSGDDVPQAWYL